MAIDRAKPDEEIDLDELLDELEHKIDRLKVLYEQYFMGIEKMEPQTARKEVSRKLIELTQMNIRNTATRYRFNALNQKHGVYVTYWNRVTREIENGTYYRNVARAGRDAARRGVDISDEVMRALPERMRARILKDRAIAAKRKPGQPAQAPVPAPAPDAPENHPPDVFSHSSEGPVVPSSAAPFGEAHDDESFDERLDELFDNLAVKTPKPKPAPAPSVRPAQVQAPKLPPGVDEQTAQALFKRYVQAKRALGENTESLRYEQLVSTLSKQAPRIMEQHKAKGVEFEVVIKENKVILKATPKK